MNQSMAMRKSWPWMLLSIAAVAVLGVRLQLSFDLSAFFPSRLDLSHDILLHQFQSGPGSRLLVIGISGADEDTLKDASDQLRASLAERPEFGAVMNGEPDESAPIPEPIASYYQLIHDVDYGQDALQRAVDNRLQDLAFGGGSALIELMGNDPYLVTLDILERLAPVDMSEDMWFAPDGSAVLMVETRATAVDLARQGEAVTVVRAAFSALPGADDLSLEITGAGVFGVELQSIIREEAKKRSFLASAALLIVLFVFYRRLRFVFLATVPIGVGFLVGLAVVSALFDTVHGITLAFGFTLMGVAIDYPLHLFSHANQSTGRRAIIRIWPTMRLGAISTAIAYLALSFSGSGGLAQLGVFTASGIVVALLATRIWVPYLMDCGEHSGRDTKPVAPRLNFVPAIVTITFAAAVGSQILEDGLWDDRLTSLSPVPQERLVADSLLRSSAGSPDMRYQLFLHDPSLDALLSRSEDLDKYLAAVRSDGLLQDWRSVTQVLPSLAEQERRKRAIPGEIDLRERLAVALQGTPFRANAFDGFVRNAVASRSRAPLTIEAFIDTPLESWLRSHLIRVADQWVSLVSLQSPDPEGLASRIAAFGDNVVFMDMRETSAALMRDYRNGAITTVSLAAIIILLLLWYQRRMPSQVLWVVASVVAGLALTVATVSAVHGQLTVIHLVALLLVMGLGLDYSLFLSRSESADERAATRKAVLACVVSTTLAFGILAGSSIPVLKFIGLTVAAGSAGSYMLALAGSRSRQ